MAIIDSKIAEEAQRQAREYAQRNDTAASQDWQQPPPAYEEATVATASSSSQAAQSSVCALSTEEQQQQSPLSRPRYRDPNESISSDESMPLLTRRQEQRLRKKLKFKSRVKKGLRYIIATLLLACIALLFLDLTGLLDPDGNLPPPEESDGVPIDNPIWSPSKELDPGSWYDPHTPLYSSFTNFTFDAFKALFVHEFSNDAINSGQCNIVNADAMPEDEWRRWNRGVFHDRIHVQIEARYTNTALRDAIRVSKMQMNADKEGVGIYGGKPEHYAPHSYISFHIFVYLPSERQRTPAGIDKDGSSYISQLEVNVDNMRIGIEGMQDPDMQGTGHITFGTLKTVQSNGGITIVHGIRANNTIDFHLQNGPVVDLRGGDDLYSLLSPRINIVVINGPIWLHRIIARDDVSLKTSNGGINITGIAIAKAIKIHHSTGFSGGVYRAQEFDVTTANSDTILTVDLTRDLYRGFPGWEDEEEESNRLSCQQRSVRVEVDTGDALIDYINHDPLVQLHSLVSVKTGAIRIKHDRAYEGSFEASNTLGSIEVKDVHSQATEDHSLYSWEDNTADTVQNAAGKVLIITKAKQSPAGKLIEGRTWYPDHSWNDRSKFCPSYSHASTKTGRLGMYF